MRARRLTAARALAPRARKIPSPLVALEFLTVLRLRRPPVVPSAELAAALLWYPSAGLILGGILAGFDRLLTGRLPPAPTAALLVAALCGLTGLLHLDGLADSADGLFGVATRERRLEIMRDSRSGAFAVAAVCLHLLLTFAAVVSLVGPARTPVIVVWPVAGRAAMVAVMAAFPYVRSEGLGSGFHAVARSWVGLVALLTAALICGLAAGPGGLALLGAGLVAAAGAGLFARSRIGGLTGDVIGATCLCAETAVLLVATGLQSQSWLRPPW
jgi:adenosylcobinamide-GDP ribazoletransferase